MTIRCASAGAGSAGTLEVTFGASVTAPAQVRMLVGLRLASWGLGGLVDDMAVIASELVTNAVRWGGEREIRVRFTREPAGVLLAVWDSSDDRPIRKRALGVMPDEVAADADALNPGQKAGMSGRGLPLVEALASECGVTVTAPAGKWVWARLAA
ncbi:ATP-binding protein [Actinomadura decatromicini]|uniref:ATP-binding protein n=1 Tax=Actinomadura decatromicini TaxID=2604572 RepID=A0A5D3FDY4_9ACTN|nr:ATP-binding protein [Actinomadura decatromicini]TYK47097.1 ATP-binding protein [Actinomadura decatromicini]